MKSIPNWTWSINAYDYVVQKIILFFLFFPNLTQDISQVYSTRKALVMIYHDSVNQKNSNSIRPGANCNFSFVSRSQQDKLR